MDIDWYLILTNPLLEYTGLKLCYTCPTIWNIRINYAPVSVNPWERMGNPGDSDSFLISHPGVYDNGVQTQGSSNI